MWLDYALFIMGAELVMVSHVLRKILAFAGIATSTRLGYSAFPLKKVLQLAWLRSGQRMGLFPQVPIFSTCKSKKQAMPVMH